MSILLTDSNIFPALNALCPGISLTFNCKRACLGRQAPMSLNHVYYHSSHAPWRTTKPDILLRHSAKLFYFLLSYSHQSQSVVEAMCAVMQRPWTTGYLKVGGDPWRNVLAAQSLICTFWGDNSSGPHLCFLRHLFLSIGSNRNETWLSEPE